MPNGKNLSILSGVIGRFNTQTDNELQKGTPERIDRLQRGNNMGKTGPRGISSFPPFSDSIFVGHIPTYRPMSGVTLKPGNSVDDTAEIPAIMAGNPLP